MPTDHPDTAPSDLAPAARGTAIRSAEVLVTSPDRNFVTLRITTRGRRRRPRRRDAQRPRAVGGVVPDRPRGAAAARPGRAPHRGHLAVPVPLGVLAARAGDHGRDRRGRRGAVGHQGEGRRAAAVPAARRGQPDRDHGVRARERPGPARAVRLRSGTTRSRASAPSACRPRCPGIDAVYGVAAQPSSSGRYDYEPAQRAPLPAEEDWDTRAYLRHLPAVFEAVRNEFGPELPLLHDGHHRMTPIQAARLGKDLEPYDLFWLEDCTPGGEPGGAAAGPAAHHHAAGHRRGVQHRLGLPDADPRAAHRLRALRRHAHRRHHRAAQDPRLRRAVPDQVRHPRADRHLPRRHGRRAAPGPGDPQLRHPGVHAARRRAPTRCSGSRSRSTDGYLHPGDRARPRRRATTTTRPRGSRTQPAYLPVNRLKDGTVHDW